MAVAAPPVAHVIGLGKSGSAAALLLQQQGWQVILSDRGNTADLCHQAQTLRAQGIHVELDWQFSWPPTAASQGLPDPTLIVISPGVPWGLPGLVGARAAGIPVIGEVELAWRALKQIPWVGITGTNGKTTTTALTAAIFQASGLHAPACGNIGYSICEVARRNSTQPHLDWVIAELSSYQLESLPTLQPKIALWTTFTPDHLERHGSLENYCSAKCLLLDQAEYPVLNADDPYLRNHLQARYPQAWWTSTQGSAALPGGQERGVYLEQGWVMVQSEKLFPISALAMPGVHNQQNLLLAVAAAHLAGIDLQAMVTGIKTFPGVPHRLERICTWQGIDFINDSKATNYDAAEIGLQAVSGPVILIAGGQSKKGQAEAWLRLIQTKVVQVLLIGDAAQEFSQLLTQIGYINWENVQTLPTAIQKAMEIAPGLAAKTILFSPACASFDQYRNFEERGEHFRQLCPTELP